MPDAVLCPGCGAVLAAAGAPAPDGFRASGECWALHGELAAWTLSLGDASFPHQHLVDAYAAQHGGPGTRPITLVLALVGLYLACERGLSGRAVQRAHQALARTRRDWPALSPPADAGPVTAADVLGAAPGPARLAALRAWAAAAWQAWRPEHARVRALVAAWLPGDPARFERQGSERG